MHVVGESWAPAWDVSRQGGKGLATVESPSSHQIWGEDDGEARIDKTDAWLVTDSSSAEACTACRSRWGMRERQGTADYGSVAMAIPWGSARVRAESDLCAPTTPSLSHPPSGSLPLLGGRTRRHILHHLRTRRPRPYDIWPEAGRCRLGWNCRTEERCNRADLPLGPGSLAWEKRNPSCATV